MKLLQRISLCLFATVLIFAQASLRADTFVFPHVLEYQGRLTDASGTPVPDASRTITFRLYGTATGGTELWSETHPAVQSFDGLLAVSLGTVTPIPMDIISLGQGYTPEPLYLEIQIQGESPLTPRTRLGATLYSAVAQRLQGDVSTEPGELLIVPVAINKGIRFVANDTETGFHQWDAADSTVVTPAGMKIFDRWGELIFEGIDISASGIVLMDSVGDTAAVFRSQDDGNIQNFRWTQVGGPFKFDTRTGARESGSSTSLRAMTATDTSGIDLTVDTGDVILYMNKAELIDAIAKEAKLSLTNSGAHLVLKAFGYENGISVTGDGVISSHIDSTGDTLDVWRSNNDTSLLKLGTTNGGVEMVNTDSIAAVRLLDRLMITPKVARGNDPIPGIDIIVQKKPSGPVRKIAIGPSSGYNGILATSDTLSASFRLGGGGSPSVTCNSDGTSARLSLDGRSSFDPNGGAIAYVASASGCTLVVMDGPSDTTWMVDQGGNMRADGYVSIGTPEQLAALTVAGDICATGSIGACSDERFKTDIRTIQNALELIAQMRGVNYRWNRQAYPERNFEDKQQVGLIAQELLQFVPEAVSVDKAGYYSIDYGKLTPVLVEAIKEQQVNIDSQSAQISALQSELMELRTVVEQLVGLSADKPTMRYGGK